MLTVTGADLRDVDLIKKYAYFCLSRFVSNANLKKANILIEFVDPKSLKDPKERKELRSFCAWMSYDGVVNGKKKFVITLKSTRISKRAKTKISRYRNTFKDLAHELVHIKQYLNNELFDYKDGNVARYKNVKYSYNTEDVDWTYWDAPFEIEAYGRSEGLFYMFEKLIKKESKV